MERLNLTPQVLITAYANGLFPMADGRDSKDIHWYDSDPRGILPLDKVHLSRSLQRTLRRKLYTVSFNRDFTNVMRSCADLRRNNTWINDEMIVAYSLLHRLRLAHSVEAWKDGILAGGVYGVALGGAFFAESMFTRETDAGKVALVHLIEHLQTRGFALFDTQMTTNVTRSFGAIEINRAEYHERLRAALEKDVFF